MGEVRDLPSFCRFRDSEFFLSFLFLFFMSSEFYFFFSCGFKGFGNVRDRNFRAWGLVFVSLRTDFLSFFFSYSFIRFARLAESAGGVELVGYPSLLLLHGSRARDVQCRRGRSSVRSGPSLLLCLFLFFFLLLLFPNADACSLSLSGFV